MEPASPTNTNELCDVCGAVISDESEPYALVPDSSRIHTADPTMDGKRLIVACSQEPLTQPEPAVRRPAVHRRGTLDREDLPGARPSRRPATVRTTHRGNRADSRGDRQAARLAQRPPQPAPLAPHLGEPVTSGKRRVGALERWEREDRRSWIGRSTSTSWSRSGRCWMTSRTWWLVSVVRPGPGSCCC